MKVCTKCGVEIYSRDGENRCSKCAQGKSPRKSKGLTAKQRHAILTDLGLVRVRGAMGGTYYE
jgi:uncharacterized membrane protein YvbJ